MAALALNQGELKTAVAIARTLPNDPLAKQIYLLALAEMGHIDEVIKTMSLMFDGPEATLCQDVVGFD